MSKKRTLLIILAIACVTMIILYAVIFHSPARALENPAAQNPAPTIEPPEMPQLVVPESPLGALGLISASAAALAIFIAMKKTKTIITK